MSAPAGPDDERMRERLQLLQREERLREEVRSKLLADKPNYTPAEWLKADEEARRQAKKLVWGGVKGRVYSTGPMNL